MKKITVALAAILISAAANAQTFLGGEVHLGVAPYEHVEKAKAEKTLQIFPTIGFEYDDHWEFGASFGFGHKRNIGGEYYSNKETRFLVKPFARYSFWDNGVRFEKGDLSAFVQGNLLFDKVSTPYDVINGSGHGFKTWERDRTTIGLSINPGLKYNLTENVTVVGTFGELYARTSSYKSNDRDPENQSKKYTTKSGGFGLDVESSLTISLYYYFWK